MAGELRSAWAVLRPAKAIVGDLRPYFFGPCPKARLCRRRNTTRHRVEIRGPYDMAVPSEDAAMAIHAACFVLGALAPLTIVGWLLGFH
jgi:hypothetical protein